MITLSGVVTGTGGAFANAPIIYRVNGESFTTTTDADGRYTIMVDCGACVSIAVGPIIGVIASPLFHAVRGARIDRDDLDFALSPLV